MNEVSVRIIVAIDFKNTDSLKNKTNTVSEVLRRFFRHLTVLVILFFNNEQ